MSAASGISVDQRLVQAFNETINGGQSPRFVLASITSESITLNCTIGPQGTLEEDLTLLQDVLRADVPAYILAKLDLPTTSNSWLAISYVPDITNIRAKMLYASSRSALTKGLGSSYFIDTLFANSLADLTAESYRAHLAHNAAPKPLSEKEREAELAKLAEKSIEPIYEGSRARKTHVGRVGLELDPQADDAIQSFIDNGRSELITFSIDPTSETLMLVSRFEIDATAVGSKLPQTEASFSLYRWRHCDDDGKELTDIVFVYACPISSPIKLRMLYSSGIGALVNSIKERLGPEQPLSKRIELSDPIEFNEDFIRRELGYQNKALGTKQSESSETYFSKPRGPGRRR